MRQNDLRRQLGVTAATVSKMVRSLVDLGLLKRSTYSADRRTLLLELTEDAIRLLRVIHRRVIEPGYVWLAIYSVLQNGGVLEGPGPGELKESLDRFRAGFRDRAQFFFQWCDRTLIPRRPRIPRAVRASGAVLV
jgi:DNA-binding MarR family transcriptional regulator